MEDVEDVRDRIRLLFGFTALNKGLSLRRQRRGLIGASNDDGTSPATAQSMVIPDLPAAEKKLRRESIGVVEESLLMYPR